MNIKVLFAILLYYGAMSLIILMMFALVPGFSGSFSGNLSNVSGNVSQSEFQEGGLFSAGQSFGRFVSLLFLGIGLPNDTPLVFVVIFGVWQTLITILSIGWLISAVWDG